MPTIAIPPKPPEGKPDPLMTAPTPELCDFCSALGIKSIGIHVFRIKYKTIDMVHEKEKTLCHSHWNHTLSMLSVEGRKKEHQFEGVEIIARTDPIKEEGR